jgi:hypothetical protein
VSDKMMEMFVRVVKQGEEAVLITMDDELKVWIPHSLIGDNSDITADSEDDDEGILEIPTWKAVEARLL